MKWEQIIQIVCPMCETFDALTDRPTLNLGYRGQQTLDAPRMTGVLYRTAYLIIVAPSTAGSSFHPRPTDGTRGIAGAYHRVP